MIFLRLFFEFFKTGLFSIGGGLATIPFLQDMGEATGWFTNQELTTMIAVSESTPGPMGVNMATYVGYHMGCNTVLGPAGGILGAVIATLGLVAPSIIVILIIARFLQKFRHSRTVEAAFQGLRPASTALIVVAGLSVAFSVFFGLPSVSFTGITGVEWKAVVTNGMRRSRAQRLLLPPPDDPPGERPGRSGPAPVPWCAFPVCNSHRREAPCGFFVSRFHPTVQINLKRGEPDAREI